MNLSIDESRMKTTGKALGEHLRHDFNFIGVFLDAYGHADLDILYNYVSF